MEKRCQNIYTFTKPHVRLFERKSTEEPTELTSFEYFDRNKFNEIPLCILKVPH